MMTSVLQVSHLILISWVCCLAALHWEHLIWSGGISWKQFVEGHSVCPCMCTSWSVHSSHQSDWVLRLFGHPTPLHRRLAHVSHICPLMKTRRLHRLMQGNEALLLVPWAEAGGLAHSVAVILQWRLCHVSGCAGEHGAASSGRPEGRSWSCLCPVNQPT